LPRVIVVGAGAAGTMAAIFAASKGADTRLLERTKDGGRKILISGGGRCNILPAGVDESRFVTDSSPHTLRHMVRSWPLGEQIAFFEEELQLPLVEERESAKLFPQSQRARDVRDKLFACARRKGVQILTDTLVTGLVPRGAGWIVERHAGDPLEGDAVILATGGLSVPQTGSDGRGLEMARHLGHAIHPTYAALTPLLSKGIRDPFSAAPGEKGSRIPFDGLSGVSLRVTITARSNHRSAEATGGFLFTHEGFSGPAVLDVSHVAVRSLSDTREPAAIAVRWSALGDSDWEEALRPKASRTVLAAVGAALPHRLAEALVLAAGIEAGRQLSQLTRTERLGLIELLVRTPLGWTGHEGYKKAEVTGGGVGLGEIDPRTMESRRHKGLFLCGEMLDAFGPIGGYNFLWAWATGRAAGIGAAR
jgi:predicted Rossmann fold flavoprotein